jgi:hypothetical protein
VGRKQEVAGHMDSPALSFFPSHRLKERKEEVGKRKMEPLFVKMKRRGRGSRGRCTAGLNHDVNVAVVRPCALKPEATVCHAVKTGESSRADAITIPGLSVSER